MYGFHVNIIMIAYTLGRGRAIGTRVSYARENADNFEGSLSCHSTDQQVISEFSYCVLTYQ